MLYPRRLERALRPHRRRLRPPSPLIRRANLRILQLQRTAEGLSLAVCAGGSAAGLGQPLPRRMQLTLQAGLTANTSLRA